MRQQGTITQWKDEKNYGFITPRGGGEPVFVHVTAFGVQGRRPAGGETVSFEVGRNAEGQTYAKGVTYPDAPSDPQSSPHAHLRVSLPVFCIFVAGLAALVLSGHVPALLAVFYAVMSLITFAAYALDRIAAQAGGWQAREAGLHLMAFLCGWPGALLAQCAFSHKVRQAGFLTTFWITVTLNCFALCWTQLRPILG